MQNLNRTKKMRNEVSVLLRKLVWDNKDRMKSKYRFMIDKNLDGIAHN